MGYSINDKLKFGVFVFDVQTEVKDGKLVGEILHNGRVIKRVEKNGVINEKEEALKTQKQLVNLIISKIKEKIKTKTSGTKPEELGNSLEFKEVLKNKLADLLEIEVENIIAFYLGKKDLNLISVFSDKFKQFAVEKWLEEIGEEFLKFKLGRIVASFVEVKKQKDKFFIVTICDSNFQIVLVVSGMKLAGLRRNLATIKENVFLLAGKYLND